MAFFVGGKELDTWVDLGGADQGSSTTHVDIDWNSYRSDGFKIFKVYITDCYIADGYKFEIAFLTADNTPTTLGMYGGAFAHGEADPDVSDYDIRWNNQARIPVSANQAAASLSGSYRGNFEFTVNTGNDVASGVPNYWWHGTMRVASTLASNIAGGGTCTQNARYGMRMTTSGPTSSQLFRLRYKLLGMKNV